MIKACSVGIATTLAVVLWAITTWSAQIYDDSQYDLNTGHFQMRGSKMFMIGTLQDRAPWDHIDGAGKTVHPVNGTIEIDVDTLKKKGTVVVTAKVKEGNLRIVYTRFHGWSAYQDGGLVDRIYEHGDSGNGDTFYPKTWLYLAGFGDADVYLNNRLMQKTVHSHFMVTEGIRDDHNVVRYPNTDRKGLGGDVDPSKIQIHLWIRWGKEDKRNYPPVEHFWNFFWKEVTWQG